MPVCLFACVYVFLERRGPVFIKPFGHHFFDFILHLLSVCLFACLFVSLIVCLFARAGTHVSLILFLDGGGGHVGEVHDDLLGVLGLSGSGLTTGGGSGITEVSGVNNMADRHVILTDC